jgi:hypothetical protein
MTLKKKRKNKTNKKKWRRNEFKNEKPRNCFMEIHEKVKKKTPKKKIK